MVDGQPLRLVARSAAGEGRFVVRARGESPSRYTSRATPRTLHLFWDGVAYRLVEAREGARPAARHDTGALEAPMPGRVSAVKVAVGQRVAKGEELLVVEAMKMENALRAPRDGVVRALHASVGEMVAPGRDARGDRRARGPGVSAAPAARVTVVEVGPRDGLQNESAALGVDDRVAFCDRLVAAGLPVVEVGAFVSPKWVPQMAGSDEVLRRVRKPPGVRLPVLVPNRQGFERARAAGAREIAVFTAASESFSRRNTNASIDETFERFAAFVPEARREGLRVRGYLSTAFGCPYEGPVAPERASLVARRLVEAGCDEVSIGDTIGVAVPTQVSELLGRMGEAIAIDARSPCISTTRAARRSRTCSPRSSEGVAVVDSAAGGTGGCPYAPGASGNLATEDLLYMLHGMGIETGVDLAAVAEASRALAARLGRTLPSRYLQAGPPAGRSAAS